MRVYRRAASEDASQIAGSTTVSRVSALLKQQITFRIWKTPDFLHHSVKSEYLAFRVRSHLRATGMKNYTAFSGKRDE